MLAGAGAPLALACELTARDMKDLQIGSAGATLGSVLLHLSGAVAEGMMQCAWICASMSAPP